MQISWKIVSIISRFLAVAIGLVQSILIVKLLSVEDYGLIKLVGSIAAVVGVYQNLGLSSGSTREIAAAKDRSEAFKVFISSLLVRYAISLPLVIGLFISSFYLGHSYYAKPEIILPIQIFALILFIQALQSVLNSVIQGLKKFKFLFIFQVAIAVISVIVFIPFIYSYGYIGFFYANLIFTINSTIILFIYSFRLFKGHIEFPTKEETKKIVKSVFAIGLYVYVIKIIFVQWQNLGPLMLAKTISELQLGYFAFALLISTKVLVVSDAITDVTLPSMTELFEKSKEKFKNTFLLGNSASFIMVTFATLSLILLKYDLFKIMDLVFSYIGKDSITQKYQDAFYLMDPLAISFWAYSQLNLLTAGLAIPMKKLRDVLISYFVLFGSTVIFYRLLPFDPAMSFSISMILSSLLAYVFVLIFIKRSIEFYPITGTDILYFAVALCFLGLYYLSFNALILFVLFTGITYLFYKRYIGKKKAENLKE